MRLLFVLFSLFATVVASPATGAPNFIVIIGDDVGWDAFGCTGVRSARTPAIDELAAESCQMDRFYCGVSQCAPLRAELYTGLYPINNGVLANAVKINRPGIKNIADHLRPLGYEVGLAGKRHFGLGKGKIDHIPGFNANANGSGQTHSFDGVRAYIEATRSAQKNFCVIIGATHAHHPWDHGEESHFPVESLQLPAHYVDSSAARQAVAKHAAEVEVLDQQVGQTRDMMREMGLEGDTVLIFLSEQGIAMPRGKWSPYEHGSRALCLAHWQGHIPARRSGALAMYCDIVPTLIDLAGGSDPELDGQSLADLWKSDSLSQHRDAVLITNVHPFWQKALVEERYKIIWSGHPDRPHIFGNFDSKSKFFSQPWQEWKALAQTDATAKSKVDRIISPQAYELYDVIDDPYELNDLAKQPEHAQRVDEMRQALLTMMTDVGEPIEPNVEEKKKGKKKNKSKE